MQQGDVVKQYGLPEGAKNDAMCSLLLAFWQGISAPLAPCMPVIVTPSLMLCLLFKGARAV